MAVIGREIRRQTDLVLGVQVLVRKSRDFSPDFLASVLLYGLTVLNGSSPQAYEFAMFILSIDGQRVLAKHGFAAPALPQ